MGKFEEAFAEPFYFSDGTYVISGEYSIADAAMRFSNYMGEEIATSDLEEDSVRFGFPPDSVAESESLGACWHTGGSGGRGSKRVWVIQQ